MNVTRHLKPHLTNHQVFTMREMQWGGIKNGKLMTLCEEHEFAMLLTIDKNLQYQQNFEKLEVIIVVPNSLTSNVGELITFLPAFQAQLANFRKRKVYLIDN